MNIECLTKNKNNNRRALRNYENREIMQTMQKRKIETKIIIMNGMMMLKVASISFTFFFTVRFSYTFMAN